MKRAADPLLFLVGHKGAIGRLAADRSVPLLGALLVLSASLARNYDGAFLLREGHVLAHGLVVSVGNATLLFFIAFAMARARGVCTPPLPVGLVSFVGLFWMTSPMAWLYAIPYERFMDPVDAVTANLWTLAGVAAWRVLLISRTLAVLYSVPWWRMLCVVASVADVLILIAAATMPGPVVDVMGGLQHAPEHALLSSVRLATAVWSVLLALPLLVAALVAGYGFRGGWTALEPAGPRLGWPVLVGLAAMLAWVPALAFTQPEQARRWRVDSLMKSGRVSEALAELSLHAREDYPPMWDPPPRAGYADSGPTWRAIADGLSRAEASSVRPWVVEVYTGKALTLALGEFGLSHWQQLDAESLRGACAWAVPAAERDALIGLVRRGAGLEPELRLRLLDALTAAEREGKPGD